MGTACNCEHNNEAAANWQGNTGAALQIGQGFYLAIFNCTLNPQGQPGYGSSCGVCYELQTTGMNAYGGGPVPAPVLLSW